MQNNSLVPNIGAQMREEFVMRAKGGTYIYLVIWLLISVAHDVYQLTPLFFAINTLMFAFTAVARNYAHNRALNHNKQEHYYNVLIGLILYNALHWGVLSTWVIYHPDYFLLKWICIVISAALALGGTYALSLVEKVSIAYVLLLLIPPLIAGLFYPTEKYPTMVTLGAVLIAYSIYTNHVTKKVYINNFYRQLSIGQYADRIDNQANIEGLFEENNTLFMLYLKQAWQNNSQSQRPVSILILSITNAQAIKEQYGMIAWQASIEKVNEVISYFLKPDSATISKPDETGLMILLHQDDLTVATELAEQINAAIKEIRFRWFKDKIKMTSAIGAASLIPNENTEQETLIRMAQKALYTATQNDANSVATWGMVNKKAS